MIEARFVILRRLSALALVWALAAAAPAAADASGPATQGGYGLSLHRLGPDARSLRFEGETGARAWSIYVTPAETQTRARMRLSYSNAISIMPEASTLAVSVNDVEVARAPIAAASDPGVIDAELPHGLLTVGYNTVRISVSQRHRVDCTLEATYELWTQIDPASSGLLFPGLADPGLKSLDDLAAISPDAAGVTPIRALLPAGATTEEIDSTMQAVEAVTIRAGVARPEVEMVGAIDARPGLWVIAGERARLAAQGFARYLPEAGGAALTGADVPGRAVVVAVGEDAAGVREAIAQVLQNRLANGPGGLRIDGATRVSFHDLGLRSEEFSGRLYRAGFDLLMPADFYPADYDRMTLSISAGYSAGLSSGAQILVRVNDKEAGSLPMRNPRGDLLRERPIAVSLSALRPGVNHILVEAQTPTARDAVCDVRDTLKPSQRFALFDRSELIVPELARIARLPNLAATLSSGFPYTQARPGHLFLAGHDSATLGAAASFLARAAALSQRPLGLHATFDAADLANGSALLFGAVKDFDATLLRPFALDISALHANAALATEAATEPGLGPRAGGAAADLFDQWAQGQHGTPVDFGPRTSPRALYDRYINVHRSDFAWLRDPPGAVKAPEGATLMLAQARAPVGGDATWTLVVGANGPQLARDMRGLVAPANWDAIDGRAAAFKPTAGAVVIAQARDPYFVATRRFTPGNFRLVAAGWLSSNLDDYVLAFALGALILGLLTHVVVKSYGART